MAFATFERRDEIGIVTLDRPDRLNAIMPASPANATAGKR